MKLPRAKKRKERIGEWIDEEGYHRHAFLYRDSFDDWPAFLAEKEADGWELRYASADSRVVEFRRKTPAVGIVKAVNQ